MSVKVIGIGNCLMGDDAIGMRILERIAPCLRSYEIEVVIGETDFEYCISIINNDDFVFIIDASILGKELGEITKIPLENLSFTSKRYTQHLYSLLDLIHIYHKDIQGFVFCVEVETIANGLILSQKLEKMLDDISLNIIYQILLSLPRKPFKT
jgi:hydrogenase maturation protease